MKIDVILPAGGRIGKEFADEVGTEIKALINFGAQTVLDRTLQSLREVSSIGRIAVIGPQELQNHRAVQKADAVLPEGATGPENIFRGIKWLQQQEQSSSASRVLIVTTDLPFISAGAIEGFLNACPREADICVPIISRQDFAASFPGSPNFYVRLRDGHWTLGCAFLLNPTAITSNRAAIEQIFAARKSQFQMARLLGPVFIARFLTRRLATVHIQNRCEQVLGCHGAVVFGCAPELAFDIDLPEDYHHAQRVFQRS